jgi:four helix bundle protein
MFIDSLTKDYPDSEKFGLISQMNRAGVSIPSNIAEGCSRNSEKEYKRYLEIAMGSAFELETQLIIAYDLDYHSEEQHKQATTELNVLQKQINKLIGILNSSSKSSS